MKKLLILLTLGLMFGQTKLETRMYTLDYNINSQESIAFDLNEITGYNLSDGFISFMGVDNASSAIYLVYGCNDLEEFVFLEIANDNQIDQFEGTLPYNSNQECYIRNVWDWNFDADIKIAITAEFPIEDTGYMEEDFDFCINEGLNLVSYPCENDIAINDALPSEISNNLSSIVGEGVAGVNNNGTWVGSLTQLQSGSGYWFNSNIEACFNYECAEN